MPLQRRRLLAALATAPFLPGCASPPWPAAPATGTDDARARALLAGSAQAHGLPAFRRLKDINVAFSGQWRPLVARLQPDLVDADFRGVSEERLLPAGGLMAQDHRGPAGHKQVLRRWPADPRDLAAGAQGEVQVWRNGQSDAGPASRQAAALVCDGYRLFLLGPMLLADVPGPLAPAEGAVVDDDACDALHLMLRPGLGLSAADRLTLYISRRSGLMRRVRLSLEGLASTAGAVAEVDLFDPVERQGVRWPTRFAERLLRPIPGLPVHDWQLTGLDLDRGYGAADLDGSGFGGAARLPARPLA